MHNAQPLQLHHKPSISDLTRHLIDKTTTAEMSKEATLGAAHWQTQLRTIYNYSLASEFWPAGATLCL